MVALNPLSVVVTPEFSLDAGTWEAATFPDGVPYRLIHPPSKTIFLQLVDWLTRQPAPRTPIGPAENYLAAEARALWALCFRWGSYLVVPMDSHQPLWPLAGRPEVSHLDDDEMMRINIEAAAALEFLIHLRRVDPAQYAHLCAAARALPLPATRIRENRDPNVRTPILFGGDWDAIQQQLATWLPAQTAQLRQRAMDALRGNPDRALANTIVWAAWRTHSVIENYHAGRAPVAYPLRQCRFTLRQAQALWRTTTGVLYSICDSLHRIMEYERSPRSWEERAGYLILFGMGGIAVPQYWSMDAHTCPVTLWGPEPDAPQVGVPSGEADRSR